MEIQESSRFVETINRDDGSHDVIVTVLDNPSFPLFRYAIWPTEENTTRIDINAKNIIMIQIVRSPFKYLNTGAINYFFNSQLKV